MELLGHGHPHYHSYLSRNQVDMSFDIPVEKK